MFKQLAYFLKLTVYIEIYMEKINTLRKTIAVWQSHGMSQCECWCFLNYWNFIIKLENFNSLHEKKYLTMKWSSLIVVFNQKF